MERRSSNISRVLGREAEAETETETKTDFMRRPEEIVEVATFNELKNERASLPFAHKGKRSDRCRCGQS